MTKPKVSIICAIAENRAIGKNNDLLWRISNDLKRFKDLTLGHPVIMGKKTFDSIGKALPGRTNIILTSKKDVAYEDCLICHSLEDALKEAEKLDKEEIFVIGGGQVYAQAISQSDRIYLTVVKGEYDADTFFPEYPEFTKIVSKAEEESQGYRYQYLTLEKETAPRE